MGFIISKGPVGNRFVRRPSLFAGHALRFLSSLSIHWTVRSRSFPDEHRGKKDRVQVLGKGQIGVAVRRNYSAPSIRACSNDDDDGCRDILQGGRERERQGMNGR